MMGKFLRRLGVLLLTAVLFVLVSLYATLFNIAHGASPAVRDILVLAAKQSSATKWIPGLFFSQAFVDQIVSASEITDQIDVADLMPDPAPPPAATEPAPGAATPEDPPETAGDGYTEAVEPPPPDPWDAAVDGMLFDTYLGPTFKAYVLRVKDPSRVFTAKPAGNYGHERNGVGIFDLMKDETLVAAINGGGFYDPMGTGSGGVPLGLTYSDGKCVWDDGAGLTFIGFDADNRLIVENGLNRARADALGVRDGCCFQSNSMLIQTRDDKVTAYYADASTSLAQRTAIGQTADGTVILMVTEGRSAAYPGANKNDIINAMLYYDAVTAAMLDGGWSSVMCYRDFYIKYGYDPAELNRYQELGLLNSARSFFDPRRMPTYFAVRRDD